VSRTHSACTVSAAIRSFQSSDCDPPMCFKAPLFRSGPAPIAAMASAPVPAPRSRSGVGTGSPGRACAAQRVLGRALRCRFHVQLLVLAKSPGTSSLYVSRRVLEAHGKSGVVHTSVREADSEMLWKTDRGRARLRRHSGALSER
jgi:hypothetical protein